MKSFQLGILCTALIVCSAAPAGAFGVGAKMGYRTVADSAVSDAYDLDQGALSTELFADLGLFPLLSIELGGGSFNLDGSGEGSEGELEVSYAVATGKVHLPADDIELYAGLGYGYYSLSYSGRLADLLDDNAVTGMHGVAGIGFYPVRPLLIFLEGRYSVIEDSPAGPSGGVLDLGGLLIQAGVSLSW
jgi:hypothetical protein